jgi:hypothetical protein
MKLNERKFVEKLFQPTHKNKTVSWKFEQKGENFPKQTKKWNKKNSAKVISLFQVHHRKTEKAK